MEYHLVVGALEALGAVVAVLMALCRVVLFLIGPGLLYLWWRAHTLGQQSAQWSATPGTVRRAELVQRTFHLGRGRKREGYRAEVDYEYSAKGRSLSSAKVTALDAALGGRKHYTGHRPAAEALLQRYPVGAEVTVYYDPRNEDLAILEPGPSSDSRFLLFLGIAFCFGSYIILF